MSKKNQHYVQVSVKCSQGSDVYLHKLPLMTENSSVRVGLYKSGSCGREKTAQKAFVDSTAYNFLFRLMLKRFYYLVRRCNKTKWKP